MADAQIIVEIIGETAKLKSALSEVEDNTQKTFQGLQNLGKTLSIGITAPLMAMGTAAVKASMDFNGAMANVAALIPENVGRVEELKKSVQELSVETGKSTGDLARGLYEVISAFGDSSESIEKLEIAVKAAKAGAADTVDAVRMLSVVTKGYGDTSAEALQKVSDLSLMTVKLGQTTFPELADALGRVTPLASSLGVSLEELHTVFATLTGVTGNAAEVSTQFRAILSEMLKPSKDLAELLHSLGYEGGKQLIEAMGGVVPALQSLYEAVGGNEERFTRLFGRIEGVNAALALTGPQAETFQEKLRQMGEASGFTEEAFKAQTETINAAGFTWEQFRAKLNVLMEQVGDKLLPVLSRLLDHLGGMLDWFSKLSPGMQDFLLILAGAAAASGPIVSAVGAIGSATSAFSAFGSLFAAGGMLGPAGLVAVGVVAVATLIITHWDEIKEFLGKCWDWIKGKAEQVWGGIKGFFSGVWEGVNAYHQASMEQSNRILMASWETIKKGAEVIWGGIKSFFAGLWGNLKTNWETAWSGISSFLSNTWESISEKASKAWEGIKSGAQKLWDKLVGHSIIPDMVDAINKEFDRIDVSVALEKFDTLVLKSQDFADAFITNVATLSDSLANEFFPVMDEMVLKFEEVATAASQSMDALTNKILGVVGQIGNIAIGGVFGEQPTARQVGGVITGILGFFSGIPTWIATAVQMFIGWIDAIRQKTKELVQEVAQGLSSAIQSALSQETWGEALLSFSQSLNAFVYQYIVDAMVKAFLASAVVQDAMKEFALALNKATKEAMVNGVFNPEAFVAAAQPAIDSFKEFWINTGMQALEVLYNKAKEIGEYISGAIASASSSLSITAAPSASCSFASAGSSATSGAPRNWIKTPEGRIQTSVQGLSPLEWLEKYGKTAEEMGWKIETCNKKIQKTTESSNKLNTTLSTLAVSQEQVSSSTKELSNSFDFLSTAINNALGAVSWELALGSLYESLRNSLINNIVKAVAEGFLKASALKDKMQALASALSNAIEKGFKGGAFDPATFDSVFSPAINKFIDAFRAVVPAIEKVYTYVSGLSQRISSALGLRTEIAYRPVEVHRVVSLPTDTERPITQINIQNTFVSPSPLDEREVRRQLELFMRMLSYEVGLA